MKKIVIIGLFVFTAALLGANEVSGSSLNYGKRGFRFNGEALSSNDIVPYSTGDWEFKAKRMKQTGIAGAVYFGLSFPIWVTGVALLAYNAYNSSLLWGYYISIIGTVLTVLGQIFFWVGLTLMIVGFATHAYYKKRARTAIFMDSSYDGQSGDIRYGLAFKL